MKTYETMEGLAISRGSQFGSYLGYCLEHRDEHKLDESDLGRGLRDFVTIHEGCNRKAFHFFSVRLQYSSTTWVLSLMKIKPHNLESHCLLYVFKILKKNYNLKYTHY